MIPNRISMCGISAPNSSSGSSKTSMSRIKERQIPSPGFGPFDVLVREPVRIQDARGAVDGYELTKPEMARHRLRKQLVTACAKDLGPHQQLTQNTMVSLKGLYPLQL